MRAAAAAILALGALMCASAQQLEPRAFSPSPIGVNFLVDGLTGSSGDIVFDPSLQFTDVSARVRYLTAGYARSFAMLGRSATLAAALPYAEGYVEGNVEEAHRRADRSGLGDLVLRFAVNIVGGPALEPREFAARKRSTAFGAALTVSEPTGQYDEAKLVNLGTNRWGFKPELGFTQPIGKVWLELSAGVWLYTNNQAFYGGHTKRQDPLSVAQAHVVYEFRPQLWLALDGTWYGGGATSVDGGASAQRVSTTRAGVTLAVPVSKGSSIKMAYARGTSVRVGSRLDTLTVAWQYHWLDRRYTQKARRD